MGVDAYHSFYYNSMPIQNASLRCAVDGCSQMLKVPNKHGWIGRMELSTPQRWPCRPVQSQPCIRPCWVLVEVGACSKVRAFLRTHQVRSKRRVERRPTKHRAVVAVVARAHLRAPHALRNRCGDQRHATRGVLAEIARRQVVLPVRRLEN